MRHALAALLCCLAMATAPAIAADRVTAIGIMADNPEDFALAMRIASAVDHKDGMRILPIAGKGPTQTLNDLIHLKGVDAAVMQSDVLAYAMQNGLLDVAPSKISYVVKLGSQDVVLLARKEVASLADLAGRRVATGTTADASFIAAHLLLDGAEVAVEDVPLAGDAAVTAVADGSVDAAFLVGSGTAPAIAGLKTKGLRLLPLQASGAAAEAYAPALLTSARYPNMLRKGESVETVSASTIVAVFEWPRGSPQDLTIGKFADAVFAALGPSGDISAGINLAAMVPGWSRAGVAEDHLKQRASAASAIVPAKTEN